MVQVGGRPTWRARTTVDTKGGTQVGLRITRIMFVSLLVTSLLATLAPAVLADGRCSGVYGIELFVNINYGTPSTTFCGSAGSTVEVSYVGGINDMTSSYQIFNRPHVGTSRVRFWEHADFMGQYFDAYESRASMPSGWNDRISSLFLVP
jgi:hypothetical protein